MGNHLSNNDFTSVGHVEFHRNISGYKGSSSNAQYIPCWHFCFMVAGLYHRVSVASHSEIDRGRDEDLTIILNAVSNRRLIVSCLAYIVSRCD